MPHVPLSSSVMSLHNVGTDSPDGQQKKGVSGYFNLQRSWQADGVSWVSDHCSVRNCPMCLAWAAQMANSTPAVSVSDGLQVLDQLLRAIPTSDIAAKYVGCGTRTSADGC